TSFSRDWSSDVCSSDLDSFYYLVGHLRNVLTVFALEPVFNEPLADKLLRKLTLGFAILLALVVPVGIEVPGGVRGVYLVDKTNLTLISAKLILGVNQDQSPRGGELRSPLKQPQCIVLQVHIFAFADYSTGDDFFAGDVFIMAGLCLCRRCNNELG